MNINRMPKDQIGIYIIWRKKLCIYVGETTEQSLGRRLNTHYVNCENYCFKNWIKSSFDIYFNYSILFDKALIKNEEKKLIKLLKPLCNIKDN